MPSSRSSIVKYPFQHLHRIIATGNVEFDLEKEKQSNWERFIYIESNVFETDQGSIGRYSFI